jgi:hypothetical protein
MIDAFAWGLLIAPLAAQLVICRFLYLLLRQKLLASDLSVSSVNLIFCAVMVIIPWPVSGVGGGLGLYFYTHYASLRPASWDVGLIWTTLLLLGFSYFVSVVCAVIVCAKLWVVGKRTP